MAAYHKGWANLPAPTWDTPSPSAAGSGASRPQQRGRASPFGATVRQPSFEEPQVHLSPHHNGIASFQSNVASYLKKGD